MLKELEKKSQRVREDIEVDNIRLREKDKEQRIKEMKLRELKKM